MTCKNGPPGAGRAADTVAAQGEYMATLAALLDRDHRPAPAAVVADICHAIEVIAGAGAASLDAYVIGLRQGKAAAEHAVALVGDGEGASPENATEDLAALIDTIARARAKIRTLYDGGLGLPAPLSREPVVDWPSKIRPEPTTNPNRSGDKDD